MQVLPAWKEKYSDEVMDKMRYTCDPIADAVAAQIERKRPSQMVDEVYERARTEGGAFSDYVNHMYTVPTWLDWDLLEKGRKVILAFANVRGISLLVSSLVEGYALSKPAHVLISTGRLHQDVLKRIFETTQMSHNMTVPGGIQPGAKGHRTIMEVRLLHAMVRKYLKQRDWDTSLYDEPINQEDMAFTIIEFDYLAVRGMEKMGATLTEEDRLAVHHFWRYGAYLNGLCEELITETPEEMIYQYDRIRERQTSPNDESRALTLAVLDCLAGRPPFNFPKEFLYELSRLCLGDELADAYQLPRSPVWQKMVNAYIAANKASTFAHYHIPGIKSLSRKVNFQVMQSAIKDNLDSNPDKRAFRHIA